MSELVILRAADEAALAAEIRRLVGFLDRVPEVSLVNVAYTCTFTEGDSAIALIVDSVATLRARLVSAGARLAAGGVKRIRDKSGTYYFRDHLLGPGTTGKLAFVYPGVMSFYPDMLRDLAIIYDECRGAFDELEEALLGDAEFTPSSFIFPPAPYYRHDADIFKSGAYAQALVSTYAAGSALTRLLKVAGLVPDGVVGCAGGDLAAMMRSGAVGESLSRPDRLRFISHIYKIVHQAVNHGGLPEVAVLTVLLRHAGEADDVVASFPADKVTLAVAFSPRQRTYVVARDYAATAQQAFAAAGIRAMELALDRPFNTEACHSLVPVLRKFADSWMKHVPTCEVYTCTTADRLPDRIKVIRRDVAERWEKPIRFEETVRKMHADGYRVFLEVGPRGLMTAAVDDTLKGEEFAAIALNSVHRSGRLQLQHALGQLVALGARVDCSVRYRRLHARRLDFDSALSMEVRRDTEMKLSRHFPKLTLLSGVTELSGASFLAEPKGRGAKVAARAAVIAQQRRKQRQFDFGAMNPLTSDAETLNSSPGVSTELSKTFTLSELPFVGDFALGTSQLSYADPNLKGLVLLSAPVGIEIMAEVAGRVMPNRTLVRIDDFQCRRTVAFANGALTLFVRAERVASDAPGESAVKVQIRDDSPNAAYTWPVMEATVVLANVLPSPLPLKVEPLSRPRTVHWSSRDIYPVRLCCGKRLRGVQSVETWSESGIDYEIVVPDSDNSVAFTRFPQWMANPLLLHVVTSGFGLWRSHERLAGAFSFPFRMRQLSLRGVVPEAGSKLNCYLRLTGVTPKSQICEISVTDGNGQLLMTVSGWEELTERVPSEYRDIVMQPAVSYLSQSLGSDLLGGPSTDFASSFVSDVPYGFFEKNEELWLKTLSQVVLDADERREFAVMTGSTARRTEWLFGRAAAKEAVRRFLRDFYQARWSNADIRIWCDDSGKPHALGAWNDYLTTKIDIAISHTERLIVALAAANAKVGIDVEDVSRSLSDEFAQGVFTPEELELAAQAANSSHAGIKFWCAKEAVSKALGTGIRYSPKEMVVTEFQADTGILKVRLEGAWVEAFKKFKGRTIDVTVRTLRDHALASCFIPASLFEE